MSGSKLQGWRDANQSVRAGPNSIILVFVLHPMSNLFFRVLSTPDPFFSLLCLPFLLTPKKKTFSSESRRQQYVLCIYAENSPFCCLTNLCFTYVRNVEKRSKKKNFHNLLNGGLFFTSLPLSLFPIHFIFSTHSIQLSENGGHICVRIYLYFIIFSIKIRNEKEKRRRKTTVREESDKRRTNTIKVEQWKWKSCT